MERSEEQAPSGQDEAASDTPPRGESQAQSSEWTMPQEASGVFPYQDLQTMMLTVQQQQLYQQEMMNRFQENIVSLTSQFSMLMSNSRNVPTGQVPQPVPQFPGTTYAVTSGPQQQMTAAAIAASMSSDARGTLGISEDELDQLRERAENVYVGPYGGEDGEWHFSHGTWTLAKQFDTSQDPVVAADPWARSRATASSGAPPAVSVFGGSQVKRSQFPPMDTAARQRAATVPLGSSPGGSPKPTALYSDRADDQQSVSSSQRYADESWKRYLPTKEYRKDDLNSSSNDKNAMKYYDKDPPPKWDGHHAETTWRPYRKRLQFWFARTDIPKEKQGFLLWEAISGPPKILFENWTEEHLKLPGAAQKIFDMLIEHYKYVSHTEQQDDFENGIFGLSRKSGDTLLDFVGRCRAA